MGEGVPVRALELAPVIHVNAVGPALPELGLQGPSRKVQPGLVEVGEERVPAGHADQNRRELDDPLETPLAFTRARELLAGRVEQRDQVRLAFARRAATNSRHECGQTEHLHTRRQLTRPGCGPAGSQMVFLRTRPCSAPQTGPARKSRARSQCSVTVARLARGSLSARRTS